MSNHETEKLKQAIKDTGGPAFGNVISLECVRVEMEGAEIYEPRVESGNLTVRDYFAAKAQIDVEVGVGLTNAKLLMGSEPASNTDEDPIANLRWWTMAETKYRYLVADTMIDERAK